jgi:hypothetical protein
VMGLTVVVIGWLYPVFPRWARSGPRMLLLRRALVN